MDRRPTMAEIEAVKEEADKRREQELKLAAITAAKEYALAHPYLDTIQTVSKHAFKAACWIAFFWFLMSD